MTEVAPSLLFSLRVAGCATLLNVVVAVPLAYFLSRVRFPGKSLLEAFVSLPLVLPPTVTGYFLIVTWGRHGWLGSRLDVWFGHSVMFHWHGAVLAAATVSFPLLYLSARTGFNSVRREMEDVARLCGAGPLQVFWYVSLPLATRAVATGLLLAFARAVGEFGATVMVLGDISRYQTLPILIYNHTAAGTDGPVALAAVAALTLISVFVVFAYNRSAAARQD